MATNNPYRGSVLIRNNYYIHKHVENIGQANGNGIQGVNPDYLIDNYETQKEKIFNTSKAIFKNLLSDSINEGAESLLETAFNNDDNITKLTNEIQSALQESLSVNIIEKGLQLQKDINIDYNKIITGKGKQKIEEFDKLLQVIADACKLLQSKEGNDLAAALLALQNKGNNTQTKTLGKELQKALDIFSQKNKGESINRQRVQRVVKYINDLGNLLIKYSDPSIKKDADKRKKGMASAMSNLFGTGLQEVFTSMVHKSVNASIDSSCIKLIGDKSDNTITVYDKNGNAIKNVGSPKQGKTDILLPNVKVKFSGYQDQDGGIIDIDIGISNKAYVTNFGKEGKNNSQTYSLGSGGSLKYAIEDIYELNFHRYLAYNLLVRQNEADFQDILKKMYDLILTREFVRIASSRNEKEFSQFIVANGRVVSIWQLIMSTKNFVGETSSTNKDQAISLSIPYEKRQEMIKAGLIENQKLRYESANKAINNTSIYGKLHLDKLISSTKSQS